MYRGTHGLAPSLVALALLVVASLPRGCDLVGAPGGEWLPIEEPDLDEEEYRPPLALLVTIVVVATLFLMAIVGALLAWGLSVSETREWENVEQGIGAFAAMLR